jgi:hypothetical protein
MDDEFCPDGGVRWWQQRSPQRSTRITIERGGQSHGLANRFRESRALLLRHCRTSTGAPPINTIVVFGLAAPTAAISRIICLGMHMCSRSMPSASKADGSPTSSTTTSTAVAAVTAASMAAASMVLSTQAAASYPAQYVTRRDASSAEMAA